MNFKDFPLLKLGHEIQMVAAMYQNAQTSEQYLVVFPDEHRIEGESETLFMTNDNWKDFLRQTDFLDVEVSGMKNGQLVKAILRKSQRQIDQNVSWNVYRRDNYTCCYCGRNDVPLTVDHIDLWEEGGVSIEENLLSCCKRCNKTRGNIPYEIWIVGPDFKQCALKTSAEDKRKLLDIVLRLPELRAKRVKKIRTR